VQHIIRIEGDPQGVPAEDGETILDAALRSGTSFAYSCQSGSCGTCKCQYIGGDIRELECSEQVLSAAERARRVLLACRTQVRGDVQIRRLTGSDVLLHPSRVMQCRVAEMAPLTHDVVGLRFSIEAGGPFTFSAGQFAKLAFAFAPEQPRDYSMANAPHEAGLEFHVRLLPGGVSALVRDRLAVGDLVRISGPFGASYLRADHRGPILAVAGGTGLAPMRAIVAAALAAGMPGPIHLYVGMREERDVYGEAELRAWEVRYPNLRVHVVLSDPQTATRDARRIGLVSDTVRTDFPTLVGWHAYVAGPPGMVDATTLALLEKGIAQRDIHTDPFYGAAGPTAMQEENGLRAPALKAEPD